MNVYVKQLIQTEKKNRIVTQSPQTKSLVDEKFPAQANFIKDPARLKAAFCSRRGGKSSSVGRLAYQTALDFPGCNILILALTRRSVKNIFWKDILKDLNKKFNLRCEFNGTELTATLPNGSVIRLAGADDSEEEAEKYLGAKYKLVAIDEAASFRQDLRRIVYQILFPATTDEKGTICLTGTPGDVAKGLFYDITLGLEKERVWSLHKWNTTDNPYMAANWKEDMESMIAANPRIVETPAFRRMYLAEWVINDELLIYHMSDKNLEHKEPPEFENYVLGVDLGYNDDSAFVVLGYTDKLLHVVEAYKKPKMNVEDVANRIKYYQKIYNPFAIITDPASKQVVEDLKQRYGIPLRSAEKTDKFKFIDVLNTELVLGRVKIWAQQTEPLLEEMRSLIYDERAEKRKEHPGCANHCTDSFLYAWRFCYNFLYEEEEEEELDPVKRFFNRLDKGINNKTDDSQWWEKV